MRVIPVILGCALALLSVSARTACAQEQPKNEVEIEFNVLCNANGELDAKEGTTVRVEVEDNDGNVTTLTYTFPQGSHARAITSYFADALRKKGFDVEGPQHDDGQAKSRLKVKNVKKVRVGTSLNGKLPVPFILPPPPPPSRTPQPTPPPVITGRLPRLPQPTPPPKPAPTGRRPARPTTFPPHGPGSIQILVTQGGASGGTGGTTTDRVTISVSATQGDQEIVLKEEFEKGTSATEITRRLHEKLVQAGFDLKPYQPGDTQLFFNKVTKLDGAYSSKGAKTTFGWGETPIAIDDRKSAVNSYVAPRFGVTGQYQILRPDLGELNDYLDWINTTWNGDIDELRTLQGGSIEANLFLGPRFGIGAGFRMVEGSASGRSIGGDFRVEIELSGGYLLLLGRSSLGIAGIDLGLGAGAGYFSGRYTETEESWKQTGTDSSIGLEASIRLSRAMVEHLSITGSVGYQSLRLDNFDLTWVSPGDPPVEMDLSGMSLGLGVSYAW
jgi:hypothetical protein